MRSLKSDPVLHELLGDAIRPQPEWWLNGDPRIIGHVSREFPLFLVFGGTDLLQISQLQGNIDVSFRIKGSKGATVLPIRSDAWI